MFGYKIVKKEDYNEFKKSNERIKNKLDEVWRLLPFKFQSDNFFPLGDFLSLNQLNDMSYYIKALEEENNYKEKFEHNKRYLMNLNEQYKKIIKENNDLREFIDNHDFEEKKKDV